MRKLAAIIGPPEVWAPLCREHCRLAEFVCVSPLRAAPKDDVDFSLFMVDLFSGRYDVLVTTCQTAVEAMVGMARGRKMLDRFREAVNRSELITIGEKTTLCATHHGLKVSSEAPEATTEALIEHVNVKARRVTLALLRSDHGSPQMIKGLEAAGWKVEEVQVYSLILDESEEMQALLDRLEDGEVDVIVFPTPAHVEAFLLQLHERCGPDDVAKLLEGMTVAAMGRETKKKLEEHGILVKIVPEKSSSAALLRSVVMELEG
ncbi:MAG: uroporphyrinogen-III synthase [Methanomassiliicoccales archaeon]|nr:uroporphyrinogen-III synthase [Methanomassiliicoccales archaeon]